MNFQNAYQSADALTGAPYFGPIVSPTNGPQIVNMTVQQLVNHIRATEFPQVDSWITQNIANASARGLSYIAYEGGQHLVGIWGWENNQTLTNLLHATNRSPLMYDLYSEYFQNWKNRGGSMFCHFADIANFSKWGSWGSLEYVTQNPDYAPKFAELQNFIVNN
jgi:hypothetical protein